MTKDELRRALREKRKAFVTEHNSPFPFAPGILEFGYHGASVGAYAATRWEANLGLWHEPLLASGVTLALPYIPDRGAPMEFRRWDGVAPLEKAAFGFQQPPSHAAPVHSSIILIPLIGFDRSGGRLGQGAGHYDRYLANHPNVLKLGIGWSCQEVDSVPSDPWDVPLDVVITEREWIVCAVEKAKSG